MVRATFVGRDRELRMLADGLAEAQAGDARVVLCCGEPGVGKTRLAEELVRLARVDAVPAVWGRILDVEGAPPYWLWRQVLRGIAEVADATGIATVLGVACDLARFVADDVAGVLGPSAATDHPADQRFRMFDAVTRFLDAAAAERGLVVVLDDIHWADEPSLLLLRYVAHNLTRARLLVLATYRRTEPGSAGELAALIRLPVANRLELAGLRFDEVRQQLTAIVGRDVPTELARQVYDMSGGNPFFVGELARDLGRATIPVSVRAAIAQRTADLSAESRSLLGAAAVLGREFSVAVLAAVVGRPVVACLDPLREAEIAGLIETTEVEQGFRFVHALTRDVVEAGLPAEVRVRLHRAAAAAIEDSVAGAVEYHLSELARHWAAAAADGERSVAAEWVERAGDDAVRRLAYEEAVRLYALALTTGAGDIDDFRRYRLLLSRARALRQCGDVEETRAASLRAAAVARRLGSADLVAEAVLVMECLTALAWDRTLRQHCADALAGLGDASTGIRARVLSRLAETEVHVADLAAAVDSSRQALAVAERCGDSDALIDALRARHLVLSGPDGLAERAELANRMLEIGRQRGSQETQMSAHSWRIDAGFARGDLAAVAAELEQLTWCATEIGGPTARWLLLRYRGALAQARGDFPAAREHAEAAFAAIAPIRHPSAQPVRLQLLGVINHHTGAEHAALIAAARSAQPGSAATPGHAFRAMDHLGPALILAETGYVDEAAAKLRALGPVQTWQIPHYYQLPLCALGILVGIHVRNVDAVRSLRERLSEYRGQHVVAGTEVTNYLGPVELYVGKASRFLGLLDDAVDALDAAVGIAEASGAQGFRVEAQFELSSALAHRRHAGDLAQARLIVAGSAAAAHALGMAPYHVALGQFASDLDSRGGSPLTSREREVAALIGRGLTNRQIAAELYISERTAQNHVQHILTKLGFNSRSQVAVWASQRI
jgi:DNA-binding CsgD family transcriptional regulator